VDFHYRTHVGSGWSYVIQAGAHCLEISAKGAEQALKENSHLRHGLNVYKGKMTIKDVASNQGYDYHNAKKVLGLK